jgi:hypothetical protein
MSTPVASRARRRRRGCPRVGADERNGATQRIAVTEEGPHRLRIADTNHRCTTRKLPCLPAQGMMEAGALFAVYGNSPIPWGSGMCTIKSLARFFLACMVGSISSCATMGGGGMHYLPDAPGTSVASA